MFGNVLVGVDGLSGGRDAISLAKQLADPVGRITLLHLYGLSLLGRFAAPKLAAEQEEAEQLLALERADSSVEAALIATAAPSVGRGLHEVADREQADLLVIGSCHRGALGRVLLGDDTRAALNGAPCAVAIAPRGYAERGGDLTTIGVGFDGSPESDRALAAARALAARHEFTIRALTVISLDSIPQGEPIPADWRDVADRLADEQRRRWNEVDDVDGDATYGEPSDELARFGEALDLLIVGSRSYGPVGRLFNGSTSNYLARYARCPLLVLPRSGVAGDRTAGHDGVAQSSRAAGAA